MYPEQKKEVSVVFFASFEGLNQKGHRMEKFSEEKTAADFFDWVVEMQADAEKAFKGNAACVNCKIIR